MMWCGSQRFLARCPSQGPLRLYGWWRTLNGSTSFKQQQHYSSQDHNDAERKTKDFQAACDIGKYPIIIWPSLINTIRNWIFANLIIRPYYDKEFSLKSFKEGSKHALIRVTSLLASGSFGELEELVESRTLKELRANFQSFSVKDRLDIAIALTDIFFCFPFQVGVMFNEERSNTQRVFVEITMCYHVYRGFEDYLKDSRTREVPFQKVVYDNSDRISIVNYRFIREFTKGVEDQWTVNLVHYFKPGSVANG